ncbi:hypothetical protein PL75_03225 [Neisseria arctica]|uniref:Uncharacterized protein n=1 Tax=Neisseria arctica TaxID=1470200 RepID=A0A0J0YT26_9NEIS|nr:hypothetical protein [Neisseria arctica]KLT73251.1 hypothetical protein PL75_03225 [Neisseria arctica]UOO87495.1 hypothetical protein LVJ86_04420 [Neisseria arctica]
MEPPKQPEYSYLADWFFFAFEQISRARRYEQGIALPLRLVDITAFAECEDMPVSRSILNRVIFAIDDVELARMRKK